MNKVARLTPHTPIVQQMQILFALLGGPSNVALKHLGSAHVHTLTAEHYAEASSLSDKQWSSMREAQTQENAPGTAPLVIQASGSKSFPRHSGPAVDTVNKTTLTTPES